jgi:hypothetical protein
MTPAPPAPLTLVLAPASPQAPPAALTAVRLLNRLPTTWTCHAHIHTPRLHLTVHRPTGTPTRAEATRTVDEALTSTGLAGWRREP